MVRFFAFRHLIQFFTLFLCMVALATGFFYSVPAAHAAIIASTHVKPNDAPDIQCLNISLSNVRNQRTVTVKNPFGGAVQSSISLWVVSNCPKNHRVTNITINGQITGTCPNGEIGTNNIQYYGYAPLYPGGRYGDGNTNTQRCIVLEGNVPTASVVPTTLSITITASGSYIDGQPGQDATSNTKVIPFWPA